MLLVSLIGWWYGGGFLLRVRGLGRSLGRTADTFSIGLMFRTLFAPFKQIDAGATGKGLEAAFQAFLSRLMSRVVGFVMRIGMILMGSFVLILQSLFSGAMVLLHLAVPVLPVFGVVAMIVGWVPRIDFGGIFNV